MPETRSHNNSADCAIPRFQWVVCQLEVIVTCGSIGKLNRALSSLPTSLDQTYERILLAIDQQQQQEAVTILNWLTCSARPLKVKEVIEGVAMAAGDGLHLDTDERLRDANELLAICSSLVRINYPASQPLLHNNEDLAEIQLAHFSVKEYLTSNRIQNGASKVYAIREPVTNLSIARTCIAYLLQLEYPDMLSQQTLQEYPLAKYSASYWVQHMRLGLNGKEDMEMDEICLKLLLSKRKLHDSIQIYNPDTPWYEPLHESLTANVASPLYYACLTGLVGPVRYLLERNHEVNEKGGRYHTALQAASVNGHTDIVRLLIASGADVNCRGGFYGTALQACCVGGHIEVANELLLAGSSAQENCGFFGNSLQAASYYGYKQLAQRILDSGAEVNAEGGHHVTALHAASLEGQEAVVKLLLDAGADVNASGAYYGAPLATASARGHDSVVKLLAASNAFLDAFGGRYGTALQTAAAKGHKTVVKTLIELGADIEVEAGKYGTATQAAEVNHHFDIARMLQGPRVPHHQVANL